MTRPAERVGRAAEDATGGIPPTDCEGGPARPLPPVPRCRKDDVLERRMGAIEAALPRWQGRP